MSAFAKALLWWPAISVVAAAGWSALYRFLGACDPGDDATWLSDQPVDCWSTEQIDDAFMALVSDLEWHQS